ncbi:MAG: hypothetical protein OXH31_00840 [Gammaproteobacteria bacterium]|nr:hypothetical protein [Gammaproteobacteria bacterium]
MATNSKQSSTVFNRIALVGVSFAIGIFVGIIAIVVFQSIVPRDEQSAQDVAHGTVEQTSTKSSSGTSIADRIAVGQYNEIFKHDRVSEQYSVLYATLSQATERELKEWWLHSKNIERTSQREMAQQAILRHLTVINPQEAFRRIKKVSIFQHEAALTTVFSEWAVIHLEGAIEAASKLVGSHRIVALQAILEIRDDLSEDKRRSIATRLKSVETYDRLISDSEIAQNFEKPEDSWDYLLNDEVDDIMQTETLTRVAEAWREEAGFEVLWNIYSEIEDYSTQIQLLRSISKEDPAGALDYARGLPAGEDQIFLATTVVFEWARTDPKAALATVSTFAPSSLTTSLEISIANAWAVTNPQELIENVEAISAEYRASPLATAFSYLARKDPLEAIVTLNSVEHLVGNTSTLVASIVRQWADQEPGTATDWVLENFVQDDSQRRSLLERTLPALALRDPNKAFELAIEQPVSETGLGLDYYVMGAIVREGDIEVAKKLLPRVNDSSRSIIYGNVAAGMVDEGQTDEALELGKDLEESSQRYYYLRVFASWAFNNPKNLMESLEGLPTSRTKSIAAMQLITRNHRNPVFTDDQIDHLRTFLNSEDEASVKRFDE